MLCFWFIKTITTYLKNLNDFEQGKSNAHEKDPLPKPQHRYIHAETRAECGHYENYYIVEVPGWYEYHEIQSSRVIREFIENFKNKYKKE